MAFQNSPFGNSNSLYRNIDIFNMSCHYIHGGGVGRVLDFIGFLKRRQRGYFCETGFETTKSEVKTPVEGSF